MNDELNNYGVIECVIDNPLTAAYQIALENQENFNFVNRSIMMENFYILENENDKDTDSRIKKIISAIKNAIQKFWSKLQGVFKNVMDKIYEITHNNKLLVKKYKGKEMKEPEKKFVPGYDFEKTLLKNTEIYKKAESMVFSLNFNYLGKNVEKDDLKDFDDAKFDELRYELESKSNSFLDELRGIFCDDDYVPKDAYSHRLKMAFFGTENEINIELLPFDKLIEELETAEDTKEIIKSAYNSSKGMIEIFLKMLKDYESSSNKLQHTNKVKYINILTSLTNESLNIYNQAIAMVNSACLAKLKQDRKMLRYYIENQPKEG